MSSVVPVPWTPLPGVTVLGPLETNEQRGILSDGALALLAKLHRAFQPTRAALLRRRKSREVEIRQGKLPSFLPETAAIRNDPSWKGPNPAPGLVDRRVEITGPVDRKMIINALNSGASTFMADFEDSNAPTWKNNIEGQLNLRDANLRAISFVGDKNKVYKLREDGKLATLIVRPRGWHLDEKHVLVDGVPVSGSLFDFAVYFYNNAKQSLAIGAGPYFYLPKMESHLEARLWNDVFNMAQDVVGIPRGTIRATVLIETILAAYEMEEIIYELRAHSAGLNCGRWDYIFSFIKKFRHDPEKILPERSAVTMTVPFMDAYVRLLIKTCHRRGVHAMGGMAAQIPIRDDPAKNDAAMAKVRADKFREAKAGHDGTWVAHPALVGIAKEIFDQVMPFPNQLHVRRDDVVVTEKDLINVAGLEGGVSEKGVRANMHVGLRYMEAWLRGVGCVPLENLMEDAATAEISRSQLWQWVAHGERCSDTGRLINAPFLASVLQEELGKAKAELGAAKYSSESQFELAAKLFGSTIGLEGDRYEDFLTSLCYDHILTPEATKALGSQTGSHL